MSNALLIKIKDIPDDGLELQVNQDDPTYRRSLSELQEGEATTPSGNASFRIDAWKERIDVQGRVEVRLSQTCSRCANPFPQSLQRNFIRVFLRSPEYRNEEEVELSSAELDRDELSGDQLDLSELLHEELILALPGKPLCMADCKGICSGCGGDLNVTTCTCEPVIDPRWAVLKAFEVDN